MIRNAWRLPVGALFLVALGCGSENLQVPNFNDPTPEGVNTDPNGVQFLTAGVLVRERSAFNNSLIRDVGMFGRESYYYFPTDARFVQHFFIGQTSGGVRSLDPTGFASGQFFGWFQNMKNEVNLINVVEGSSRPATEKAAVRGFANTFRGLDVWYVLLTRDTIGMPVEVAADPTTPAPWVTRDSALKFAEAMLDSASRDLGAGGASFPFKINAGFSGFSTTAGFLKFNRAIAARVYNDHGSKGCGVACYQKAITALAGSFIATPASLADLTVGPSHVFAAVAGDILNAYNFTTDAIQFAHQEPVDSAQTQVSGGADARVQRKLVALPTPRPAPGSGLGIPATYRFEVYPTTTTPLSIIRNEELLLIRAEARYFTGDLPGARDDLNAVRQISGNLALLTLADIATPATFTNRLLYERWMSLLMEGHRWNDYRRFGRLADLPLDLKTGANAHFVARVMPIPQAECDARKTGAGTWSTPAGTCQ